MSFTNKLIKAFKLKQTDTVLLAGDFTQLLRRSKRLDFSLDDLLDDFKKALPKGTLALQSFNWDFAKGIDYNVQTSKSQTGVLSNIALKRKDFIRTKHPIYSFAVTGKYAKTLAGLDNKGAFDSKSPFAFFHSKNAVMLIFNKPLQHSFTFVHYVEQSQNVPYRYNKSFKANYTDANKTQTKQYDMFVRDLQNGVLTDINALEELFIEHKIMTLIDFKGVMVKKIDLVLAYEFIKQDILKNNARNLFTRDLTGDLIYEWVKKLFPLNRSLTGEGVRQTLRFIKHITPEFTIKQIPTGTKCFDWEVPREYNCKEAYIITPSGEKICDFSVNNLHLMGYSIPVRQELSLQDLKPHIYTLKDQPNAIPYITSYYKERWGFCMTHEQFLSLEEGTYKVVIDSELKNGVLNYAEAIFKGKTKQEIFLSSYVCHPSMANNELSGPCVMSALAEFIASLKDKKFTYRLVLIPETIGSICYLSKNIKKMQERIIAGFNLTTIGDDRTYSFVPTRQGDTLADKVARHVLKDVKHTQYSFLDRGSDERQYCSSGVDLPVATICRSKYATYPEYHTSLDNLDLVSPAGLFGGFEKLKEAIEILEANEYYKSNFLCEPQLGKRGLYPTLSTKETAAQTRNMMNLIAYADGKHSLIEIAEKINAKAIDLLPIVKTLLKHNVLSY